MADDVITWEGVPITELPRETLYEAIEALMRMQGQTMDDLAFSRRLRMRSNTR